jgi:hypothetical protein
MGRRTAEARRKEMSILIRGMEMPEKQVSVILNPNGLVEVLDANNVLLEEYQAVPVPPHGRLIDASEKIKVQMYDDMTEDYYGVEMTIDDLLSHKGWVEADVPTIIPADPAEEGK